MSWTDRPDQQPCCGEKPGAVQPNETVARLLHTKTGVPPEKEAFQQDDLQGRPDRKSNVCGDADGWSVTRVNGRSHDDLRAAALEQAGEGRTSLGASLALVSEVRQVRLPDDPDRIVVRLYDDPTSKDKMHALLRVDDSVVRADFKIVRADLSKVFNKPRIDP